MLSIGADCEKCRSKSANTSWLLVLISCIAWLQIVVNITYQYLTLGVICGSNVGPSQWRIRLDPLYNTSVELFVKAYNSCTSASSAAFASAASAASAAAAAGSVTYTHSDRSTGDQASGKWQPLSKCALGVSIYLRWQFELAECCALGLHTVQTLTTHIYSDYAICIGLSHLLRWVVPEQLGTECKLCSASCFLNQPHGTFWHCGLSKGWWLMSESSWRPLYIRHQPHLYGQINVDTVC